MQIQDKFGCMRLRMEDIGRAVAMAVVGRGDIWRAVALDSCRGESKLIRNKNFIEKNILV